MFSSRFDSWYSRQVVVKQCSLLPIEKDNLFVYPESYVKAGYNSNIIVEKKDVPKDFIETLRYRFERESEYIAFAVLPTLRQFVNMKTNDEQEAFLRELDEKGLRLLRLEYILARRMLPRKGVEQIGLFPNGTCSSLNEVRKYYARRR